MITTTRLQYILLLKYIIDVSVLRTVKVNIELKRIYTNCYQLATEIKLFGELAFEIRTPGIFPADDVNTSFRLSFRRRTSSLFNYKNITDKTIQR